MAARIGELGIGPTSPLEPGPTELFDGAAIVIGPRPLTSAPERQAAGDRAEIVVGGPRRRQPVCARHLGP